MFLPRGAAIIALALGLSGCVPGSPSGEPSGSPTPAASGASELTITVDDGNGSSTTWRLSCDPAGGDHPQPDASCRALQENAEAALPPVPSDSACAEIFGGPQTATITGTWKGVAIDSRLSRTNACEIARWDALKPVLEG